MPTPRTLSSTARAGLLAEAGPAASRLLTTVEAAALLDLSPRTLERRRTAQNPVLPHVEVVPGRVRYRLADVLTHLERSRKPAPDRTGSPTSHAADAALSTPKPRRKPLKSPPMRLQEARP